MPLVAYEGGQSLNAGTGSGPIFNLEYQAQNDPRMYQLYVEMIDDWEQAGGGLFNAYQLNGGGNKWGFWGLLTTASSVGSQKYDALLSTMLPAGDANADGIVDDSDFQALQANYGQGTLTYWAQGDFNDDGTTNGSDLNILRQNLDPSGFTLAQFAQQAVFGEPATIDSPTALEYDGYGVTYASSLPFASSSGTVKLNQNSAGQSIVLGGANVSEGLGVTANSSATIALDGQYSRFDSTIGVDSSGSTASSVIFELYGDNSLLYQSPVMAYGAAPVPIDVNVAGVQQLKLVMVPAPGSTARNDHGVWGDARLISTANFGAAPPYTLTWQVSQNGQVLSTQTADSFAFAALQGSYTITVTVTDAQGDTASASTNVTVVPDLPTAAMLLNDSVTGGNWIGHYGSQGYSLEGGPASLPSFASVSVSGASTWNWRDSTTDPRGLSEPTGIGAQVTCWYSASSFTIDVDLTDGQVHNLALYAVDWDHKERSEEIQVISADTGSVLDTETISSFVGGAYLQWAVSGSVVIKVTNLGPLQCRHLRVVPGRDAIAAQQPRPAQWIGGGELDRLLRLAGGVPRRSESRIARLRYGHDFRRVRPGTGRRARAMSAASRSRADRAATWWHGIGSTFTIDVNVTAGQNYDLALYAVDWDKRNRSEQIQVTSADTGDLLGTWTLSSFSNGEYVQWAISGSVVITVTALAGPNAVISGLFLDGALSATSVPVQEDTTTLGHWIGTYGAQGYDIEGRRLQPALLLPPSASPAHRPGTGRRARPIPAGSRSRVARAAPPPAGTAPPASRST